MYFDMEISLTNVITLISAIGLVIATYYSFKGKLESAIRDMDTRFTLRIQENAKDILQLKKDLAKLEVHENDRYEKLCADNQVQHEKMMTMISRIDKGVTALQTKVEIKHP